MATRGKASFQKRQKEVARKEKQQRKADRRAQRKLDGDDITKDPELDEQIVEIDANTEPSELE